MGSARVGEAARAGGRPPRRCPVGSTDAGRRHPSSGGRCGRAAGARDSARVDGTATFLSPARRRSGAGRGCSNIPPHGEATAGFVRRSSRGDRVMRRSGIFFRFALMLVLAAVLSFSGCKKKQPPVPAGEGESIRLNTVADIENYKEILRKDPNNLQALIGIGNLYFDTKQDLLAIQNYRKALVIDPTNANVRTDMAICYRRSGNPVQAVEELKKAISTTPRHAQSRYNLGVILIQEMHDPEGGIKAWEALLENVPDYPYRDNLKAEIARMRSEQGSVKQVYK